MKRLVIYVFLLILTFYSIYLLFRIEIKNEKNEINTIGKINNEEMLPIPTRIIYKNKKEKNYTFSNILNNIPLNLEVKEVKPEIYQMMLTNYGKGDFKNICKSLGIETTNDLLNFNLNKETIIITLSKYEIQNVKQNIGNLKYTFGNYQDKYSINILIVSKIVNTNCIYYNINNL